ncbi:DUF6950 family protein [Ramlibacter sp. Leaf400]|uniref:DUF6950 family protein n=1 Tax=Ramlibacter sp. Leaf400 TaxID=1736365 RepID=UPI0006F85B9D|nr:hypothetical protein [Ramlibacter sp. Leaf400]KQT10959.1 hypothetical protein ASG30_09175 [Ramlibacter sp. Leaf400]
MHDAVRPPRCEDWKVRLDAYVALHRATPFDWALHNCVTFAAGWIELATGHAVQLPPYDGALSAHRRIDAVGGLLAGARDRLGAPVPGTFAQCGDVVLVRLPSTEESLEGRRAFGVCIGPTVVAPGPTGLLRVPMVQAEAAWRV